MPNVENKRAFGTAKVAPALRVFVDRLIDYAGIFPPASLSATVAIDKHKAYRGGEYSWTLRWLVVDKQRLGQVPKELDGSLAVLSDADEPRAAVIEAKRVVRLGRPVYCEVPIQSLDEVKRTGAYAKLRTGGITAEAIPAVSDVAGFILACAERRLAFKATAGLHHPVRGIYPLTYEANPPRAPMHGFLNVFIAAAFAWHGDRDIEPILAETDPQAFRFDENAHWRDRSLETEQVRQARQEFAHSFGSCSFEEPIEGLKVLGLL
jgi:hypothetical protein